MQEIKQALELFKQEQYPEAISLLKKTLSKFIEPSDDKKQVMYSLARCYAEMNEHIEALELYTAIIAQHPEFNLAYVSKGRSLEAVAIDKNDRQIVINWYKNSLKIFPHDKFLKEALKWYQNNLKEKQNKNRVTQFTPIFKHHYPLTSPKKNRHHKQLKYRRLANQS